MQSSGKSAKDYISLFFFSLVAYWPIAFNFLSLKNDALIAYLPYRYYISESIRGGYFAFWSPYFYTGFPIHADIQGSAWNPFVLFFSLISTYNMTLLQWEVLIYLVLCSIGMYRLVKYLGMTRVAAICCAVAFVSCGYITDSISVIPWVSSAAFIPFVLIYFLRTLRSMLLSDALKFSFALSLLFLCGYPSFFIYLNYILAVGFVIWTINQIMNHTKADVLRVLFHLTIAYILFLLLCSPAMISYYEFLPYYPRGAGLDYHTAGENPLVPYSIVTYFLPNLASKADFLATDLSMRNTSVGALIFIFFLTSLKKPDRFKIVILVITLFSFLFSLGDLVPAQRISNDLLPLMNMFRHPGTIRVFTSIGIIILAGYALDSFLKKDRTQEIKRLSYLSLLFFIIAGIYFLLTNPKPHNSIEFGMSASKFKQFFHSISFEKFAFVLCVLQIISFGAFLFFCHKKRFLHKGIVAVMLLNSIVFAWIGLPFTAVSQYKTQEVNDYIHSFPDGFPKPDLNASIESEINSDSIRISPHGYHNFYNKRITIQNKIITPTLNTDYNSFLKNKSLRWQLKGRPFAYVTKDSVYIQRAAIKILTFSPNRFLFEVNSPVAARFQLFQQFNPNWHVKVNQISTEIRKSNIAFMNVPIPAGNSILEWKYRPQKVYIATVLSAISILFVLFYFLIINKKFRTKKINHSIYNSDNIEFKE